MKLVFSYDCKPPTQGGAQLCEQLRLGHDYFNALIEVERKRRENYFKLCNAASPELQELTHLIDGCVGLRIHERTEAADQRMEARSRKGASEETRESIEQISEELVALYKKRNALINTTRKRNRSFAKAIADLDEASNSERKRLYSTHGKRGKGLFWATQNAIARSVEQACDTKGPPRFRRWQEWGEKQGQIVMQMQGEGNGTQRGLAVADAFGDDARLRIAPLPADAYLRNRGYRRRTTRTVVRMRFCYGDPDWIELPVVLHRELPRDGVIKEARIVIHREASTPVYRLQLTLWQPDHKKMPVDPKTAIGIDVGWRWQDAIRVAYTFSPSHHGPVSFTDLDQRRRGPNGASILETKCLETRIEKSESLRSIRDKEFEEIKKRLGLWMKSHLHPEWLDEFTAGLVQWRNIARMASLVQRWAGQRFSGDRKLFEQLQIWQRQDDHLWLWEHNNRRKAIANRTELYRIWAAQIANNHSLVAIEDFDLRDSARKPPVEEEGEYDDLARSQRIMAAPSLLIQALVNACQTRGVTLVMVPCEATTITCHVCKQETRWDKAKYLCHRCECGAEWDQDYNAARNIREAGLELWPTLKEKTPHVGRWQRRKEERKIAA